MTHICVILPQWVNSLPKYNVHELLHQGIFLILIIFSLFLFFFLWFVIEMACEISFFICLIHLPLDKMSAISQTIFSNALSWMKMYEFQLKFHWSLFLKVQLIILQHWFRYWLDSDQATSHYLNQWWLGYWRIYASLGLNGLRPCWARDTIQGTSRLPQSHQTSSDLYSVNSLWPYDAIRSGSALVLVMAWCWRIILDWVTFIWGNLTRDISAINH